MKIKMGDIGRLDHTKKPAEIDLKKGGMTGFGIFEVNGDALKLIICDPGKQRPKVFKGAPKGMLLLLKRDK